MNRFALSYSPLSPIAPELGRAAILPWDSEHFGFAVGAYAPAEPSSLPVQEAAFRDSVWNWMQEREVELLSCSVPADSFDWIARLETSGFRFVDLALTAFARKLVHLPVPRIGIRRPSPDDAPHLERIAGSAFRFGRYHADPRFPRSLADGRYRRWIRNALESQNEQEFIFVSGPPGKPTGFIHAVIHGTAIDLRLAAVDPAENTGILGPHLFTAVLGILRDKHGARSAKARLSAGNISILSLYSSLGFLFPQADAVFHLHSPTSKHLLPAT